MFSLKFKIFPKIVFILFPIPRRDQVFIRDGNRLKEPIVHFCHSLWSLVIVKTFN